MNEDDNNKEFIERIAATLRNHAEPYKEGAWERFAVQSRPERKRRLAWVGWAAAALVLFTAGLFLFQREQEYPHVAQTTALYPPISTEQPIAEKQDELSTMQTETAPRKMPAVTLERNIPSGENTVAHPDTDLLATDRTDSIDTMQLLAAIPATSDDSDEQMLDKTNTTIADEHEPIDLGQPTTSDQLLAAESARQTAESVKRETRPEEADKWNIGIVVAPSVTSERLNIGGGFAVAYRISDKFSLASGVSLGDLSVAQQQSGGPQRQMSNSLAPNDAPAPGEKLDNGPYRYREITSVTSTLLAVDIPVNLRYHVTKGLYTSVGISFLGILNERRTNHFVDHINQPTASFQLMAVHSAERSTDQPLTGKGYAGFVNFSVGRNVPLSSRFSISFEPYFKLPVGRLSREDMDLTNGGIRIVTGF